MFSVPQFYKNPNGSSGGETTPYTPGEGYAAGAGNPNPQVDGPSLPSESVNYKPPTFNAAGAQNLIATNGNPLGGVYSQPGMFGNPAAPAPQTPSNPFANPGFDSPSGYNSSQYANEATANNLAQQLGGAVNQTRNAPGSPIGPPPQRMIDFGGADMLNAGLLAERYAKYDRATADAMTRAELAQMGPRSAPNGDSEGGTLGSWSQYQPVSGGQSFLGQGANLGSSLGAQSRTPQVGGTSPGFNPYETAGFGGGPSFNPGLRNGGGPMPYTPPHSPEGGQPRNPNMWASRYSNYRIPYGNRRYYPGMGAAPRFQPRQDFFQSQLPFTWY